MPLRWTVQAPHCAKAAAEMGIGEIEIVAQRVKQRHVRVRLDRVERPSTRMVYWGIGYFLFWHKALVAEQTVRTQAFLAQNTMDCRLPVVH